MSKTVRLSVSKMFQALYLPLIVMASVGLVVGWFLLPWYLNVAVSAVITLVTVIPARISAQKVTREHS